MLKAEDLTVRRGGQTVLSGVSFSLEAGQWLMVCGPNGAGKSSLLSAVTGALPFEGEVLLLGRPLRTLRPREIARAAAVMPQAQHPAEAYTVEAWVALGRYAHRGLFFGGAFVFGLREKRISTRQVHHADMLVTEFKKAFLLFDSHARPVTNTLASTRKGIKKSRFTAVRITGNCNSKKLRSH